MRVPNPSPVLVNNPAPMGPDILSSTGAGVWRKAPNAFPDSSSVLDKFQSAKKVSELFNFDPLLPLPSHLALTLVPTSAPYLLRGGVPWSFLCKSPGGSYRPSWDVPKNDSPVLCRLYQKVGHGLTLASFSNSQMARSEGPSTQESHPDHGSFFHYWNNHQDQALQEKKTHLDGIIHMFWRR